MSKLKPFPMLIIFLWIYICWWRGNRNRRFRAMPKPYFSSIFRKHKKLGDHSFQECSRLQHISAIDTEVISDNAFYNCVRLTGELKFSSKLKIIGKYSFAFCSNLIRNLVIPETVTQIGEGAFQECSGLDGNLSFPENVERINNYIFFRCIKLNGNLVIPEITEYIGDYSFFWWIGAPTKYKNNWKFIFLRLCKFDRKFGHTWKSDVYWSFMFHELPGYWWRTSNTGRFEND